LRRVRRIRVVRRRRRVGDISGTEPEISKIESGSVYRAVAGESSDEIPLVKAEVAPIRRRPVLPINEQHLASVVAGVFGRPRFR